MRIKGSYIWAVLIAVAIVGWVSTGELVIGGQSSDAGKDAKPVGVMPAADTQIAPFRVRAEVFNAQQRRGELIVRGRTQADTHMSVKAETPGLVEAMPFRRGASVKTGDLLCRIETGVRSSRILQARALVTQAQLDYEAANQLQEKGYTSDTRVRGLKALLDAANAGLLQAEIDLRRTEILAPFDGVIEADNSEIGSLLRVGDPCVTLVALDPMLVVGQVSERDIANLKIGMSGTARMVTGETAEGKIRYISPSAEPTTRTFTIELEIDNADLRIRNNVTAEIIIPLAPMVAHQFSPAFLTLNDEGTIGVRTVDDNSNVKFIAVALLGDAGDGVWVAGLPETIQIITVGHEYVVDGQPVEVVDPATAGDTAAVENGENE